MMDDTYPFTPAFGPAKTRAICVDSSEAVFNRLLQKSQTSLLPFETLSQIAYDSKGELMRDKVKVSFQFLRLASWSMLLTLKLLTETYVSFIFLRH